MLFYVNLFGIAKIKNLNKSSFFQPRDVPRLDFVLSNYCI